MNKELFIEELKNYNESLSYDKQEGKAGNKINYYLNINYRR